jgi:MFS family permease
MGASLDKSAVPAGAAGAADADALCKRFRRGFLVVQFCNSLSAANYFNYLPFYLKDHFGYRDGGNLTFASFYGLLYMISAWAAGPFGIRHGYFKTLRIGFSGMLTMMLCGGILPRLLGYSRTMLGAEWVILVFWTMSVCITWPTIQALLSQRQSPARLSRTAGIYNMVWASASALAYLVSGFLMEKFGGEILFWFSGGLNLLELLVLAGLQKLEVKIAAAELSQAGAGDTEPVRELNPRPIAKARNFLHLAWLANPFAYVAIYGVIPTIPKLAQGLGLSESGAGTVCSVWQWSRLAAFAWFWLWPGWHYKFRWLLTAFVATIASFIGMLLSPQVWTLIVAQIVFGLALGLIYYSSLYYSMDAGESKGRRGGFHEAAIGLGIFMGPGTGVLALHFFPQYSNAATWGMSTLLVLGLIIFIRARLRGLASVARA